MTHPCRIPPQAPEAWSPATRDEFAGVQPVSTPGAAGQDGLPSKPLHLPSVIAHHPTLLSPYLVWAKAVALGGVLERRDSILLALRTAYRCESEFEWGVHAETAVLRAGLSADEVQRVASGPDDPAWSARDASLLRAADELHDRQTISDETWEALGRDHADDARIEIVFVVGHYTMLSMLANSVGAAPEQRWAPIPVAPGGR
jgi:4-carboxymuconolactone decarboxylase